MEKNRVSAISTDLSGDAVVEISGELRKLLADVFALYVKRPGATTSRSEKTRFVRKCHKLSVTRGRVCVERRKEYGGAAADDRDHGGEAHGSGSSDC